MNSQFKNISWLHYLFMFLGGLLLLFVVAPIAGMYFNTSTSAVNEAINNEEVKNSIWLSLWTSMLGTLLFSLLAIPLAYILARKEFPLKSFVNGIVDIPIIIPHSAAGIAVLGIISRESFVGRIADIFGLKFVGNPAGIIVAMAFVSIPYLINAARDGFLAVPERLEKIGLTLGASQLRVFLTISLPLAWRSILSGLILMWARGMSEFGAVIIVAYNPQTAPVLIYERFTSYGLKYSVPAAVVFVSICLIVFIMLRITKRSKND